MYAPDLNTIVPPMMYSAEVSARLNEIESNLRPFFWEQQALFVTGRKNIDTDWDAYVAELDKMGYKEAAQIMQTRYDELNS